MNWNQAELPSLHHRKEGWLRPEQDGAQPPKQTQTGWFSFRAIGKPPRPRIFRTLRVFFLCARSPLLAVMQGGEFGRIPIHSHLLRPPTMSRCEDCGRSDRPTAEAHSGFFQIRRSE